MRNAERNEYNVVINDIIIKYILINTIYVYDLTSYIV